MIFWRWIFYGVWQALLILIICVYTLDYSIGDDGMLGSLFVDGQMVYLAVVVMANIKILTSTTGFEPIMIFLIIASVGFFLFFYYAIS